jgi:hypothetical protein
MVARKENDLGAQGMSVPRIAIQGNVHGWFGLFVIGGVPIDQRRLVDGIDDYVEVTVVVEVGIHGSIGKCGMSAVDAVADIRELHGARIAEKFAGQPDLWEFVDEAKVFAVQALAAHFVLQFLVGYEINVVDVIEPLGYAVGDEQVFVAIVVEIQQERGP